MESMIGKSLDSDAAYMRRAMELALLGEGWCHPNPMVGAVIVKNGVIIGEGYHRKCGELHAERNAFASLKEPAKGAALYVTLEPCCHYGRTPPCTEAIVENGIRRVVIGSKDPNPKVSGRGAVILKAHGIEVHENFLREECDALNPVFFHYITTKTPYVTMKYAMTMDGKIATRTGKSKWITGEKSREYVHRMRHAAMGIMAGIGTVLADDPMLNCRLPEGNGRNPVRIVCDTHLRLPLQSRLVQTAKEIPVIDVCGADPDPGKKSALEQAGVRILCCPGKDGEIDLAELMRRLGEEEIDSVLLEGGGTLNESALKAGIVSEVDCFVAPKVFGGRAGSPVMGTGVDEPEEAQIFQLMDMHRTGSDLLLRYRVPEKKNTGSESERRDPDSCLREL